MFRIDNNSAVPTLPNPEPPGTPGFFTGGNIAAGQLATILDAPWANSIQEELITVIQAAGITLNKSSHTQLFEALQALYTVTGQTEAFLPLTGGQLYRAGPTGADPLRIQVDTGLSARIDYEVLGVRRWRVGVGSGGHFEFADVGLGLTPFTVYGNGQGTQVSRGDLFLSRIDQADAWIVRPDVPGSRRLSVGVVGGVNLLDAFSVAAHASYFTGNITASGAVSVASVTASSNATVGGLLTGTNANFSGSVAANGNVSGHEIIARQTLSVIATSGTIGLYDRLGSLGREYTLQFGQSDVGLIYRPSLADYVLGNGLVGGVAMRVSLSGHLEVNHGWKPGGGVWSDSSDARLKKNIHPYEAGLDQVRALRPVSYQFNGLAGIPDDGQTYIGLVAQDVEPVMSEMVGHHPSKHMDDGSEILTLDCTALQFALVNSVKALAERLDKLEGKGG